MQNSTQNQTSAEHLDKRINAAVDALRNGGVVAIPTDTLYGLAANALDSVAVGKVFRLKGRPGGMPLPLLLADIADMGACAAAVPQTALALAERFWPGALTIVLPKSERVPYAVTAGLDSVALRVPDHPVPRKVARMLGAPITGTSANLSGATGLSSAQAVRDAFGDALDFILDGGDASGGVASTIIDLTTATPSILRQGAVPQSAIEGVIARHIVNI